MSAPAQGWLRSWRVWVSAATLLLVVVLVIAAWPNIVAAYRSLSEVNPWILALLVPVQLLSYWTTAQVLFSFLRARGDLRGMHPLFGMRLSLEFNFVNHVLPAAGTAGIAYASWRLRVLGVSASRSVLGQLVRFAVTFASFVVLLIMATVSLAVTGTAGSGVLWVAGLVGALAILAVGFGIIVARKRRLLHRLAGTIARAGNGVLAFLRLKRRVPLAPAVRFADGLHLEFREVAAQPRALVVPFLWSFIVNLADSMLFWVALSAFGVVADPALVFVAYGLATLASMVIVTPNGTGGYEVALIATLIAGGLYGPTVIAAVIVARVILLLGTIVFGWAFTQHGLIRKNGTESATS